MYLPEQAGVNSFEHADAYDGLLAHQPCGVPAINAISMACDVVFDKWWNFAISRTPLCLSVLTLISIARGVSMFS